jgi:hypothetical protein
MGLAYDRQVEPIARGGSREPAGLGGDGFALTCVRFRMCHEPEKLYPACRCGFCLCTFGRRGRHRPRADRQHIGRRSGGVLNLVDNNFVAQGSLGAPLQIASGRIAEKKATSADIGDYAHLMVVTHIPVVDALELDYRRRLVTGCLKNVLSFISLIQLLIGSLVELGDRDIEHDATVRKAEDTVGI